MHFTGCSYTYMLAPKWKVGHVQSEEVKKTWLQKNP